MHAHSTASFGHDLSVFPVVEHPSDSDVVSYHFERRTKDCPDRLIHYHSRPHLMQIIRGRGALQEARGMTLLSEKLVYLVPAHVPHAEFCLSDVLEAHILAHRSLNNLSTLTESSRLVFSGGLRSDFDALIEAASSASNDELANHAERVLSKIHASDFRILPKLAWPSDQRLADVSSMILENPGLLRSVESWSEIAGMSLRNFSRSFHEDAGIAFSQWLNNIRLIIAAKRLSRGQSIKEISADLGFSGPSALNKIFAKHLGCTPKEFELALVSGTTDALSVHARELLSDYAGLAEILFADKS